MSLLLIIAITLGLLPYLNTINQFYIVMVFNGCANGGVLLGVDVWCRSCGAANAGLIYWRCTQWNALGNTITPLIIRTISRHNIVRTIYLIFAIFTAIVAIAFGCLNIYLPYIQRVGLRLDRKLWILRMDNKMRRKQSDIVNNEKQVEIICPKV